MLSGEYFVSDSKRLRWKKIAKKVFRGRKRGQERVVDRTFKPVTRRLRSTWSYCGGELSYTLKTKLKLITNKRLDAADFGLDSLDLAQARFKIRKQDCTE